METQTKKKNGTQPPFLFQNRLPARGRAGFLLWQLLVLLVSCGLLTYFTLRLSYSGLNPDIWLGYWENLWIPAINLAIIAGLCLLLFALAGRAWLAFLLTAVL